MKPAALIFDCDGTLADSMPAHFSAWSETAERYGLVFPEARFYALAGMPTRSIFELLASEAGLALDLDEATRVRDEAFVRRAHEVRPFAPIIEIARAHRGRLPMAVATGGVRMQVDTVLAALGIAEWFDAIVTADDVARGKPAPDIFLEAARRLGIAPEQCLVYEDADPGITAARAAGMQVVDVRPLLGSNESL